MSHYSSQTPAARLVAAAGQDIGRQERPPEYEIPEPILDYKGQIGLFGKEELTIRFQERPPIESPPEPPRDTQTGHLFNGYIPLVQGRLTY